LSIDKEELFISSYQAASWVEGFASERVIHVPLVMLPVQEPGDFGAFRYCVSKELASYWCVKMTLGALFIW
jgi:hypothetical protein